MDEKQQVTLAQELGMRTLRRSKATTTKERRQKANVVLASILEVKHGISDNRMAELLDEVSVAKVLKDVFYRRISPDLGAERIAQISKEREDV